MGKQKEKGVSTIQYNTIQDEEVSFTQYEAKRLEHLTAVREGFLKEVTLELALEQE